MSFGEINPKYEIIKEAGGYRIFGTEQTTGESFSVCKISDKHIALHLVNILNKNKVSVHHANDVARDSLLEFLIR